MFKTYKTKALEAKVIRLGTALESTERLVEDLRLALERSEIEKARLQGEIMRMKNERDLVRERLKKAAGRL